MTEEEILDTLERYIAGSLFKAAEDDLDWTPKIGALACVEALEIKCGQCGQPLSAHRFGTPCRLFVGPASDVGAEADVTTDRIATLTAENKRLRGAYATIMELNPEDYVCGEAILLRGIQVTIRAALKGQS